MSGGGRKARGSSDPAGAAPGLQRPAPLPRLCSLGHKPVHFSWEIRMETSFFFFLNFIYFFIQQVLISYPLYTY